MNDLVGDRFELGERAGAGGMGVVFRARDRVTGADVAVKVIAGDRDDRERFAREIAVLASVAHPNIVRFIAHGATPTGEPYLVMEWLEGESLGHLLETRGLAIAQAVAVARRIADALAELHRHGIVHRDLKPSNLMLEHGDLARLKLIDFGLSRTAGAGGLTATGMIVGTPGYMSPEQARGVRDIDARSDVFSLGCVLYECITGWSPFAGEHSMAVRAKVLFGEPPPAQQLAPEAPPALLAIVTRMLAKRPADRFADGAEVAAAFGQLAAMPAGPVRRTIDDEPRTITVLARPAPQLVLIAAVGTALAPATLDELARTLGDDIEVAPLEQAALSVRIPRVELVASIARACRAALPDASIAIVATELQRGVRDAIDRGVAEVFRALLRPGARPIVWLDETARSLLGELHLP